MHTLRIEGKPVPWSAPHRKGERYYSPHYEDALRYKAIIQEQWGLDLLSGPCSIRYTFFMPMPSSWSLSKQTKTLEARQPHTSRPDLTNLQKFVEDCLKGVVLKDDSQVYHACADKFWGRGDGLTLIEIGL